MKRFIVLAAILSLAGLQSAFPQAAADDKKASATDQPKPATTEQQQPAAAAEVIWKAPNGELYATSKVHFALSATDNLSEVDFIEYKQDDSQFQKYQGPFTIADEGNHLIQYRAVDKAGNREIDHVYNITVDNTAPEVRVIPATGFYVSNGKNYSAKGNSFSIRVVDNLSGVKSIQFGVNSTEMKAYNNDVVKFQEAGTQLIQFRAEDNVGNKTIEGNLLVEVDDEKPTIEIIPTIALTQVTTASGEKSYAKRHTGFRLKAVDNGSGIQSIMVKIDGATEWQSYTDVLYFDSNPHTITAKAVDFVGNQSEEKTLSFTVDDNPPTTELKTTAE